MSNFLSSEHEETFVSASINHILAEDFYNYLYWDHRIYDLRCADDHSKSHICRSHHINPQLAITIDAIVTIDGNIDNDFGKAENPSDVLIYTNSKTHYDYSLELSILQILISYLTSLRNPANKHLKQIHILTDGYENFYSKFPFLCTDHIYYNECSQLVWPSYILPNLFLGSSMCRHERVLSMLNISHVLSITDYPQERIKNTSIKTLHLQIADSLNSDLLSVFPLVVNWMSDAIYNDKGTVLVHCAQGVSRSATVIIAYLLNYDSDLKSVDAAFNYVKLKRSVIKPNASFLQQLERYVTTLNKQADTDINT